MMIPGDLKYTKEHEWIRVDGDEVVFGITDHAQSELGDITFVELPEAGKSVARSETIATVESVKAASDLYAAVSGEIVKVNEILSDTPETINESPYEKGWVCRIKVSDKTEQDTLMSAKEYEKFLGGSE